MGRAGMLAINNLMEILWVLNVGWFQSFFIRYIEFTNSKIIID